MAPYIACTFHHLRIRCLSIKVNEHLQDEASPVIVLPCPCLHTQIKLVSKIPGSQCQICKHAIQTLLSTRDSNQKTRLSAGLQTILLHSHLEG